jgi:hypothetical protein
MGGNVMAGFGAFKFGYDAIDKGADGEHVIGDRRDKGLIVASC